MDRQAKYFDARDEEGTVYGGGDDVYELATVAGNFAVVEGGETAEEEPWRSMGWKAKCFGVGEDENRE